MAMLGLLTTVRSGMRCLEGSKLNFSFRSDADVRTKHSSAQDAFNIYKVHADSDCTFGHPNLLLCMTICEALQH